MGFSSGNAVDHSSTSSCDSSSPWFVTRKRQRQTRHEHTTNRMVSWMFLVVVVIGMLCLKEDETSTSRGSRTFFSIWCGCQAFIIQSRSLSTRSGSSTSLMFSSLKWRHDQNTSSRTQLTTINNIQNRVLGRRTTWTFTLNVSPGSMTITKQEQEQKQQPENNSSSLGYVIGDTKGAALLLKELEISRGSNIILTNVNLRVEPNQRWAIVGPNGVGKSTLLGAITGTVDKDNGTAIVAPKTRVGFLKQTAVAGSKRTVYDEVASGMTEIAMARNKLQQAEQDVSSLEEEDDNNNNNMERHSEALQRLADATNHFERVGGYRQEKIISEVLSGLGFSIPEDCERDCSEFSGGWQMRIALAKLLLSQPQLLLLDEPSNHLDSAARQWLANYLLNYPHSLILVSHDTMLLEKSNINNIADIAGKTLIPYVGCNYSKFLTEKEFRAKAAWTEYERNMEEAAKLQAFVDRFGASATKASQAQSRVKQIEKMKREGKLTPPPISVVETRRAPVLKLPSPPKVVGDTLISLKHADIGYDSSSNDEAGEGTTVAPLLTNIDLDIQRGMKLLLRGPNGAGKSTLLKALRGTLSLNKGIRDVNPSVRLGIFTQDLAQELDVTQTAVDLVLEYARSGKDGDISITNQDARTVMGMLGLSQDKSLRKIGDLSGGEKARVALSMFALKPSNVLLLDEPSNHLDVDCIQALGRALRDYDNEEKHKKHGAIVVISHDRQFCESIGTFTHVGTVQDGCLVLEQRSIQNSDWTTYQLQGASTTTTTTVEDDISNNGKSVVDSKAFMTPEQRKQLFNAPKRIKKLEAIIEKAEQTIQQIEQDMISNGNDVGKLMDLTKDKETQDDLVLEAMEEWEMLEELIQQYGGQ